jgi:hypothetical protein
MTKTNVIRLAALAVAFSASVQAQTVLNVADYGARGDAVRFYASTTAGLPLVTTARQFSSADIGKTIELFKAGVQTVGINSYGVNSTNNLDLISTITGVDSSGTNVSISSPALATVSNAFATCGTDNTPAIRKAIAAAGTNAVILFPDNGTYLCMPSVQTPGTAFAIASIVLNRGGLHFLGTNILGVTTTLLSRGAFRPEDFTAWGWGISPARGYLFEVAAPVTNDYPIVMENLTLDGGVQHGNLDVHGIYVNVVDGLGWDVGHSAWLCCDNGNNTGTATHQVFTNVTVQHWRGEMFKSVDGNNNGNISIHNSAFRDGCATALNIYGSWDVSSNYFENLFETTEYYQSSYTNISYFQNNFVTNLTGGGWAWNGGRLEAPAFIMRSNVFYISTIGLNCIQFTPAANIRVLNNEFHCGDYGTAFIIGTAGAQGGVMSSNILIANNTVFAPNKLAAFVSFGGPGILGVNGLTISNNTVSAPEVQNILVQYAGSTNVVFTNNTVNCAIGKFNTGAGQPMVLVSPDNSYTPAQLYGNTGTTNLVSYGNGPLYPTMYVQTAANFVLDDSAPAQIPAGAYLKFDDTVNTQGSYYFVYPSIKTSAPVTVTTGQTLVFYWTGTAWSTNQPTGTLPPDAGGGTTTNTVPTAHTPPGDLHIPLQ